MTLTLQLARDSGLALRDVRRLILTAPKRYKVYPIPKRNGDPRLIAQPSLEIKVLQRALMRISLRNLPVHEAAFAYVTGKSIRSNAEVHAKSSFILKLDFTNFFNSIKPIDLERVLRSTNVHGLTPLDFEDVYYLSFWGAGTYRPHCLSIGAPSSPMISNIVMYDIDCKASDLARQLEIKYTRYADDVTVSGTNRDALIIFENHFTKIVRDSKLSIELNHAKRGLYSRGERRMVTGLIITPDGSISIGRGRKREIRAMLHRLSLDTSDNLLMAQCQGLLAFVISAEPSFIRSLRRSYGSDFIKSVIKAPRMSFYTGD
jgi:hypothetical protein